MTIYEIRPSEPYLESVADFVIKSYTNRISEVKIIVPTSIICAELQKIFVKKSGKGAAILPYIMPVSAISQESELVYKIPSDNIEAIGYIEQKLLLIKIIEQYEGLSFSLLQASYLGDQLLKLFHEIEAGNIDIKDLLEIVEVDNAMHWMITAQFLVESYKIWHQKIYEAGKISPAEHQKLVLDIEMHDSLRPTIMVGITGGSKTLEEFIAFLAESKHGVVIPPPFDWNNIKGELEPLSPFYKIQRLLDVPEINKTDGQQSNNLNTLQNNTDISCIKASSELQEVELVAQLAAHSTPKGTIVIVSNNHDLTSLVNIVLQKYGLPLCNLRGRPLVYSKPIEFLLLLASSVLLDDLEKFAALLKLPFIACDEAYDFEIKYLRKVGASIHLHRNEKSHYECGNRQTIEWFENFKIKIGPLDVLKNSVHKFSTLLEIHLDCALKIVPNLFTGEDGLAACEFFKELIAAAESFGEIESNVYPDLIKQLMVGAKYFPQTESNIVALSPQEAAFIEFDTYIIADCTDGSFPYLSSPNPWMTSKMRKQIGLRSDEELMGEAHYYFWLLTQKKNLYITYSQKSKGRENVPSRFLVSLLADLEKAGAAKSLEPKYDWFSSCKLSHELSAIYSNTPSAKFDHCNAPFPLSISATNIELLLCNPYGFYAKKILGFSKLKDINMEASLADFGTLVHNIIALYTENYESERYNKLQYFLDLGSQVLDEFHENHKVGNWRARLRAIAEDFISFDEERRKDSLYVYPEIFGSLVLNIEDKQVRVTAIADRIEMSKAGELHIIDYKTGAVPSSLNVKNGMAPQLITEAIIASEGGFEGLPAMIANKLIYVKIGSSKPYFKTTVIDLSTEELKDHKRGLVNLLSRYMNEETEFLATPNPLYEPKYDDYKHLARKL